MLQGLDLLSKVFDGNSYKRINMRPLLKFWFVLPERWSRYKDKKSPHKKVRKLKQ